jgi:deoxyribonuclease V
VKIRSLHEWNVSIARAKEIQLELSQKVIAKGGPSRISRVAGADVAYEKREGLLFAVIVSFSFPSFEILEEHSVSGSVTFPYVPGYLSFRETPILLEAFSRLKRAPDVVLIDGQGIAHPRGLGFAAHVGLFLDIPTIGCAKSRLVGEHPPVGEKAGATAPLEYQGRRVGSVVRTRSRVKPIFVSPGHKIGFAESVEIVFGCVRGYRIPEPTRLADIKVEAFKRSSHP